LLVSPSRKFKKQGEIYKITSRRQKAETKYTFFLFNDLLMYARAKGEQFVLHNELPINNHFRINDLPDTKYIKNGFEIISTKKSFKCYVKTQGDKETWLEAIQESIKEST